MLKRKTPDGQPSDSAAPTASKTQYEEDHLVRIRLSKEERLMTVGMLRPSASFGGGWEDGDGDSAAVC